MLDSGKTPSPENKKDKSHKGHACSWKPGLMELRSNEQYSMPGGHCCSLWVRHLSTRFCKQWIFTSVPGPHPIFFFSQYLCWYKGVEETHSKQYKRYSFILLERKSPCQRSMARLARITVISNFQFLLSKQFLAGRSRLCALWILSELQYEGRGARKEGGRTESSYGYCCHLGDFQWRLQKWNFLGSLLLLPCGEEHAIWLEQRDHTNVEAALYHRLGQTWPFVGGGGPAQGRSASTGGCHITSAQPPDLAPHPSSPRPQG